MVLTHYLITWSGNGQSKQHSWRVITLRPGTLLEIFFMFHTIAVRLIKNCTLWLLTGEDDIARFNSWRYRNDYTGYSAVEVHKCVQHLWPSWGWTSLCDWALWVVFRTGFTLAWTEVQKKRLLRVCHYDYILSCDNQHAAADDHRRAISLKAYIKNKKNFLPSSTPTEQIGSVYLSHVYCGSRPSRHPMLWRK